MDPAEVVAAHWAERKRSLRFQKEREVRATALATKIEHEGLVFEKKLA